MSVASHSEKYKLIYLFYTFKKFNLLHTKRPPVIKHDNKFEIKTETNHSLVDLMIKIINYITITFPFNKNHCIYQGLKSVYHKES